jgi:hypothetical protein
MTESDVVSIYVLPSEPGVPPRALLIEGQIDPDAAGPVRGAQAMWSRDLGCWTTGGLPMSPELSEAITEHAKSLGVEW